MSTSPMPEPTTATAPQAEPETETRETRAAKARRQATVRRRLRQATDALAAVHLLLGAHASVRSVGEDR